MNKIFPTMLTQIKSLYTYRYVTICCADLTPIWGNFPKSLKLPVFNSISIFFLCMALACSFDCALDRSKINPPVKAAYNYEENNI